MKTIIIVPWFNYWKTPNYEEFSYLINSIKKEGYNVQIFDYETHPEDLEDLLERLHTFINSLKIKEYTLIGYSLGSYLSVLYSQKFKDKRLKQMILCCPLLLGSKLFKSFYIIWPNWKKHSGKVIHDATYKRLDFNKIPKNIEVGVIRGEKRINRRLISLFAQLIIKGKNDGLFEVSESEFGSNKITLPIGHYDGMHSEILAETIKKFLKNSSFD